MSWFSRLRNVFRSDQVADEINREMAFHIAERAADLVAAGLSPDAAHAEARRRFGNVGVAAESTRDRDVTIWVETLLADIRYGLRGLRGAPGYAVAAILSLTLGIGANTAIFTAVNAVMLRPLPVANADELMYAASGREEIFSYPVYERLHDRLTSFSGFAALERGNARHDVIVAQDAETVRAPAVTGSFFPVLGVSARMGRALGPADDRAGAPPAVVLSHSFWQRRFAGDSAVVGRSITLDGMRATIVGVMPADFVGFDAAAEADLWWPVQLARLLDGSDKRWGERLTSSGVTWLVLFGRLRAGVSSDQARAEAEIAFRDALQELADRSSASIAEREQELRRTITLRSASAGYNRVRTTFEKPLLAVMAFVGMVLLVACANVAALTLARANARQREFALRAALGGGRGRIMRQLLTESLLIAVAGGTAGFVVAQWFTAVLSGYIPRGEVSLVLRPDARVLLVTAALSLLSAVLFGLVPALRLSRADISTALKEHGAAAASSRGRLQRFLVGAQLATSVLLLVIFGLFGQTLRNLRSIDLGFDRRGVAAFAVDPGRGQGAGVRDANAFSRELLGRLELLSGVRSASVAGAGMLSGNGYSFEFGVDGYESGPKEDLRAYATLAGPRFLETVGVPLLRGREFRNTDGETPGPSKTANASVVILGKAFAHRFFGASDPIGRHITRKSDGVRLTIIGVAGDTKYGRELRDATPLQVYLPYFGAPVRMPPTFYLRTEGSLTPTADVQRIVKDVGQGAIVRNLTTMDQRVDALLSQERLIGELVAFFSIFALLLASAGLYGLVSYVVARRTREFGVRLALGARAADVLRLVLRQGLTLAVLASVLGGLGAYAASRLIGGWLYGVAAADPLTYAGVIFMLSLVAIAACWVPARRAARIDPVAALRTD